MVISYAKLYPVELPVPVSDTVRMRPALRSIQFPNNAYEAFLQGLKRQQHEAEASPSTSETFLILSKVKISK
jgi:hypothetical protein